MPTKAVILAQGAGTGPGAPGASRSQPGGLPAAPLLSVANRALLRHALDWLAAAGIHRAVVVVSEAAAKEARKAAGQGSQPISIGWLAQRPGEPLAETLTAAAGFLEGEPCVLHLADSLA